MRVKTLLIGHDRNTTARHLAFAGVLFLFAAASALAWWLTTETFDQSLAELLSIERHVLAELQLGWAYGLLGMGAAGALLAAYENTGFLVSLAISTLTIAGYFSGGLLAGIPYDNVITTGMRHGLVFGGFGFLVGVSLTRITGSPSYDTSFARQPGTLVVLIGGFLTTSFLFSALVWWLRSATG